MGAVVALETLLVAQKSGRGAVRFIARDMQDPGPMLGALRTHSRGFH